ncbi:hypothetical protein WEH80_13555 [Actinomycetes bacterium KLBMP 9759]
MTKEDSIRAGKGPFGILVASIIITALALAATFSVAYVFVGSDSVWLALAVGFIAWLGFSVSTWRSTTASKRGLLSSL